LSIDSRAYFAIFKQFTQIILLGIFFLSRPTATLRRHRIKNKTGRHLAVRPVLPVDFR
jgi:hypothetical protein